MSNERKILNPNDAWGTTAELRKEWVDLPNGSVCVWELTVSESMQILQKASRPPAAAEVMGPMDQEALAAWQIIHSCRQGDEPSAPRVFNEEHYLRVLALSFRDYSAIMAAFNRVNGTEETEEAKLRDFTRNGTADNTSPSPLGALKTSGGSRKK